MFDAERQIDEPDRVPAYGFHPVEVVDDLSAFDEMDALSGRERNPQNSAVPDRACEAIRIRRRSRRRR